jgi:hypothetical protein
MLREVLSEQCSDINSCRLKAVLDVAEGLRQSKNQLFGEAKVKHTLINSYIVLTFLRISLF